MTLIVEIDLTSEGVTHIASYTFCHVVLTLAKVAVMMRGRILLIWNIIVLRKLLWCVLGWYLRQCQVCSCEDCEQDLDCAMVHIEIYVACVSHYDNS